MKRTALHLLGLVLVVVAAWVLLTQTEIAPFVPATIVAVVLLVILGFGVMGLSREVREPARTEVTEREVVDDDARVKRRTIDET